MPQHTVTQLARTSNVTYNNGMTAQRFDSVMLASERCSVDFFQGYAQTRGRLDDITVDICVYELEGMQRAIGNMLGHFVESSGSSLFIYIDPVVRWSPRTIERVVLAMGASEDFRVVSVAMDVVEADYAKPDRKNETALEPVHVGPVTTFLAMTRSAIDVLMYRNDDLLTEGYGGKGHSFEVFSPMHRGNVLLGENAAFSERCRQADLPIFRLVERAQ